MMHGVLICPRSIEEEKQSRACQTLAKVMESELTSGSVVKIEPLASMQEDTASNVVLLIDATIVEEDVESATNAAFNAAFRYLKEKFGATYIVRVRSFAQKELKLQSLPVNSQVA